MLTIKAILKIALYKPLYNALIFLVWLMPGDNVGLAIIILTVLIRLLLLPSSKKAIESQKQMKELQPELDRIKDKYKDDKQAQAQAMMRFYQQNKINPLGSCLPLLIQFPILIILYYVFRAGLDTSRFDLLYSFIPHPNMINAMFMGMDLAKPSIYLAVVAGVLQYWQTKQMMSLQKVSKETKNNPDLSQNIQNMLGGQMMYIMPFFTIFISLKLPAALPLYWAITTIFAIVQQHYIFKGKSQLQKVQISIRNK